MTDPRIHIALPQCLFPEGKVPETLPEAFLPYFRKGAGLTSDAAATPEAAQALAHALAHPHDAGTLFQGPKGLFRFACAQHPQGLLITLQECRIAQSPDAWERSEDRLRLLMKATQSGVYDRDMVGGQVWRNEAFYSLLGYGPEQADKKANWWLSLIPKEERKRTEREMRQFLREGREQFVLEYRAKAADGSLRDLLDKGHVVYGPDRKPLRITGVISDVTRRREAERLLRDSEKKFASIFSSAPVAIAIAKLQGGEVLDANGPFLQFLGLSHIEEIAGKKLLELPIWKDFRACHQMMQEFAQHGELRKKRVLLSDRDGLLHHLEAYGQTVHIDREPCALLLLHDMTDYVEAQQTLQAEKARFRGIFEHAGVGMAMVGPLGRLVEANGFLAKLLGYRPEALRGRTIFSLMAPSERQPYKKRFLALAKRHGSAEPLREEVEFLHASGQRLWIRLSLSFIWGQEKSPLYGVAMLEDLSGQRLAEAKAQESQELLRTINNNIDDGIFRSAMEQGVVYANQAFLDMLGYASLEEMRHVPTLSLYKDPSQQSYLLQKLRDTGVLHNEEVLLRRKDGTSFWALFNCSMSMREEGLAYFDGAIVDITEQKMAQDLLRAQNEELEKINEELDRFVYSASHDLRAPLTSLLGLLQVVRMYNQNGELNQYFDMMERTITKLDLFIREIVNHSRNSRLEVAKEPIDFEALLAQAFEQVQYLQGAARIERQIHVRQEGEFRSDPNRLAPILSNLISNAIKYHKYNQEHPYIRVEVETDGQEARIAVIDNGLGIEAQHLGRIFDMFYRASEEAKGSGLGLYIVKETLSKLGGQIEVESKVNKGTTFRLRIPNLA